MRQLVFFILRFEDLAYEAYEHRQAYEAYEHRQEYEAYEQRQAMRNCSERVRAIRGAFIIRIKKMPNIICKLFG